jgi:hypothetical protein
LPNFWCEYPCSIPKRRWMMSKFLSLTVFSLTLIYVQPLGAEPGRTPLTEPTIFYVDPAKGNDENPCISDAEPCQTMQAAYEKMYNDYDFRGFDARMHLADGNYTKGVIISGHLVGAVHIQIVGNCDAPQDVNINLGEDGTAFTAEYGGKLQVACVKVSGSGATGFLSRRTGALQVNFRSGDSVIFGDMPGGSGVVVTDGGFANISGTVFILGNVAVHWDVSSISQITVESGTTYSINDTYAIDYFLNTTLNSVVSLDENVTFGGPDPNGQKYSVTAGSRLSLNGNVLPGTIPGTMDDKGL